LAWFINNTNTSFGYWSSNNAEVLSVDNNGLVYLTNVGHTVTATVSLFAHAHIDGGHFEENIKIEVNVENSNSIAYNALNFNNARLVTSANTLTYKLGQNSNATNYILNSFIRQFTDLWVGYVQYTNQLNQTSTSAGTKAPSSLKFLS